MAVLSNSTKGKVGLKAAGAAIKNPTATRLVAKASAPAAKGGLRLSTTAAKRRAQRRVEDVGKTARTVGETLAVYGQDVGKTARTVGETLAVYGPEAAQLLGWAEPPKPKRTAPRVVAGILIGATAMYLLDPGDPGKQRRAKVLELVS